MDLFIGEYNLNLTDKNRLVIPKHFREVIGSKKRLFVATHNNGLLEIYSQAYWQSFTANLDKLPYFHSDVADLRRIIYSQTAAVEMDKQGRFVLDTKMLDNLGGQEIKDLLSVIGVGDHIEVLTSERWELKKKGLIEDYSTLTDRITLLTKNNG